ncbi:MAG: hypothetical protein COT84_03245 [Chlamydiae bacterium CG10_big_fil_rev_8_21_14_0_10_35_9]|nr:MAG: hypothetical protein COT84_03245 [Chlamydiae bacterium CG10_big_fil_rev_8_21_14_0_10_35_9]
MLISLPSFLEATTYEDPMKKLKTFYLITLLSLLLPCFSNAATPPKYFPNYCHWIYAISTLGDTIQLEDGSVWDISPKDGHKIFNWKSQDALIIHPNYRWFSNYNYRILNKATNQTIEVNLSLAPFVDGENTNYIYDIKNDCSAIMLQDQSVWHVNTKDRRIIEQWALDDLIIIGVYNKGRFESDTHILINANMGNHCRVRKN